MVPAPCQCYLPRTMAYQHCSRGSWRYCYGFSLVETLVSLLMVTLAAMLVIRMSAANEIVSQQSSKKASAFRLGSELADWVQRGGHLALGVPLEQALTELANSSTVNRQSIPCCVAADCDASASAWYYLALWRDRLQQAIPDNRWALCEGEIDTLDDLDWACAREGSVLLMKLGWPAKANKAGAVIPLGAAR